MHIYIFFIYTHIYLSSNSYILRIIGFEIVYFRNRLSLLLPGSFHSHYQSSISGRGEKKGKKLKTVLEEPFQDQLILLPAYRFCRIIWEMKQKEASGKAQ